MSVIHSQYVLKQESIKALPCKTTRQNLHHPLKTNNDQMTAKKQCFNHPKIGSKTKTKQHTNKKKTKKILPQEKPKKQIHSSACTDLQCDPQASLDLRGVSGKELWFDWFGWFKLISVLVGLVWLVYVGFFGGLFVGRFLGWFVAFLVG